MSFQLGPVASGWRVAEMKTRRYTANLLLEMFSWFILKLGLANTLECHESQEFCSHYVRVLKEKYILTNGVCFCCQIYPCGILPLSEGVDIPIFS